MDETESMRRQILEGICPYCSRGPFRMVALHINLAHGIPQRQLRESLGFMYGDSICDPEISEKMSHAGKDKNPNALGKAERHPLSPEARRRKALLPKPWMNSEWHKVGGRAGGHAHKGKRYSDVEHGTRSEFRKGCRCNECIHANRAHWRQYRLQRKNGNSCTT